MRAFVRALRLLLPLLSLCVVAVPSGSQVAPELREQLEREMEAEDQADERLRLEAEQRHLAVDAAWREAMKIPSLEQHLRTTHAKREAWVQEQQREFGEQLRMGLALREGESVRAPLAGCARDREEAEAVFGPFLTWRRLTPDDFQGPPRRIEALMGTPSGVPGAVSVVEVVCIGEARVVAKPRGLFEAEVTELEYLAVFQSADSWWMPAGAPDAHALLLLHEQGHFDLVELGARARNEGADGVKRTLRATDRSPYGAGSELGRAFLVHMNGVSDGVRAAQLRYDAETSHGRVPEAQMEWSRRLAAGLRRKQAD